MFSRHGAAVGTDELNSTFDETAVQGQTRFGLEVEGDPEMDAALSEVAERNPFQPGFRLFRASAKLVPRKRR
ncbi:hypothetical protein GCM10009675_32630 [Prauserella alba]|uniref:YCII-related domain-containing protein n=1 Tax=Prauserella alba TaxID=176898 RepID=A0ABP4G1E2_9PSEU